MNKGDTRCLGWNPKTGEKQIFASPEEREKEGWLDHHPNDTEKGGPGKEKVERHRPNDDPPLTREEVIAALKEGKVEFNEKATDKQLDNALKGALIRALKGRNVDVDPKLPTRKLLAQLKAELAKGVTGDTGPDSRNRRLS